MKCIQKNAKSFLNPFLNTIFNKRKSVRIKHRLFTITGFLSAIEFKFSFVDFYFKGHKKEAINPNECICIAVGLN